MSRGSTEAGEGTAPPALAAEEFRRLGAEAVRLAGAHLAGIRDGRVHVSMTEEQRRILTEQALPDHGMEPDAILDFAARHVMPYPLGNGHPRFFAWITGAPGHMGVLAELLAAAMNPACGGGDHAAIDLESCATRWLMELIGYPTRGSKGILVSGGTMANLTALAAARNWAAREDGWDIRRQGLQTSRPRLMLYTSEEGHSSLQKTAELLGLGALSVRRIPCDEAYRIDPGALADAIEGDLRQGRRPFCVVANAGTTNTGAVDDMSAVAELCAERRMWMHVDGAYGAVGVLDPDVAERFAGMERAQSIAVDPHKWLFVPIDCGCTLVRDASLLSDAFSLVPSYLHKTGTRATDQDQWPHEYGIELTRGFRALKLWSTLAHVGRAGFTTIVARHNALARRLAAQVEAADDLESLAPVSLSVVVFRYAPRGRSGDEAALEGLNRRIVEELQRKGEVFLTPTTLKGRFALRVCILHYGTTEEDVDFLVERVRQIGQRLGGQS